MAIKSNKGLFSYQGNIILVLFFRLVLVLTLFFLSRIIFFVFNFQYFSGLGVADTTRLLVTGLRFDISAILIINTPYVILSLLPFRFRYNRIYQIILNVWFFLVNIIGMMANFIDMIYFRFTLKRTTADIFSYLSVGGDFDKLIPQFLSDFWYVGLIWLCFCTLLIWISLRFRINEPKGKTGGSVWSYLIIHTFILALVLTILVIGIRGGFQRRPITIITAGNYTSAKYVPLLLNTPFSIAKTWGHETLSIKTYFRKEKDLEKIYSPVHHYSSDGFRNYNVVVIILESFSSEHSAFLNKSGNHEGYQGFTPFLDSLMGQGLVFHAYANGKTSIQGIPAILSGIPSLMNESYIQSNYSADKITSLASLLKTKGYSSAFFHGGTNGTMGFDSYTRFTGFDSYYGRSEYGNEKDYDGKWGIRDEEFFQFTARITNKMKEPFLVSLFSLSSHHPYFVPEKYHGKLRTGKLKIQESIMYTDLSLKRFFETIRHYPWFENTLFVITADHTSEGYLSYYQTNAGQYAIPLIFYKSNSTLKGKSDEIAQQTDIMPTVLNYLGYDKPFIAFGNNLFDEHSARFSIHFISGCYSLLKDGYLLEFDGEESTGLYNISADPMQKKNIIRVNPKEKESLEIFIKAYIQQYNNRVIENRLSAD